MIKYKLKWVYITHSEKFKREVLVIPMVWRWVDGKYDKFISAREAFPFIEDAVIDPSEKTSIMSEKDKAKYGVRPLF